MWCNWDSTSHYAWLGWTTPPWPWWRLTKERCQGIYRVQGLRFQSQHSRSRLKIDIVNSSYATLRTLWDIIPLYLVLNQMGRGLVSCLRISRNIVQSEATVGFPPLRVECSNVCVIMMSPFDIKGVASLNLGHFSLISIGVRIDWGFRHSSVESRAF